MPNTFVDKFYEGFYFRPPYSFTLFSHTVYRSNAAILFGIFPISILSTTMTTTTTAIDRHSEDSFILKSDDAARVK